MKVKRASLESRALDLSSGTPAAPPFHGRLAPAAETLRGGGDSFLAAFPAAGRHPSPSPAFTLYRARKGLHVKDRHLDSTSLARFIPVPTASAWPVEGNEPAASSSHRLLFQGVAFSGQPGPRHQAHK